MLSKRLIVCALILGIIFSLTGCGNAAKPEPSLPPLDMETKDTEASREKGSSQNTMYEETLPNHLSIKVFPDGVLLLEGGNVTENLINRSIFSDYVANITTLKLGEGVVMIDEKTFQNWDNLKKIMIGDSVREIGYAAFSGCTSVGGRL